MNSISICKFFQCILTVFISQQFSIMTYVPLIAFNTFIHDHLMNGFFTRVTISCHPQCFLFSSKSFLWYKISIIKFVMTSCCPLYCIHLTYTLHRVHFPCFHHLQMQGPYTRLMHKSILHTYNWQPSHQDQTRTHSSQGGGLFYSSQGTPK